MAPECEVSEMNVLSAPPPFCPSLSSLDWVAAVVVVKISSSSLFMRTTCADVDSRRSGTQSGSGSEKPGSMAQEGKSAWMVRRGLRRSQVWMPRASRRSCGGGVNQ